MDSSSSLTDNTYYIVTLSRVSGTVYLYINATQEDSQSCSYDLTNTYNIFLGTERGQGVFFNGQIKNIAIWKGHGMTQDEVTRLYNEGLGTLPEYDPAINRPYPAEHIIDVFSLNETTGDAISEKYEFEALEVGTVGSGNGVYQGQVARVFDGTCYLSVQHGEGDNNEDAVEGAEGQLIEDDEGGVIENDDN
jgi:hypothetical protein